MKSKHVYQRVTSIYEELPRSERKIAQIVINQPDDVVKMTIKELSELSGTSPASVIRFCKSIGIPSFPDLKVELSAERDTPLYETYSDILPNERLTDVKQKLLSNSYQSMKETLAILDESVIENVVELIAKAPIIYVYGVGSSYLVAEDIAQKWNRVGKVVICQKDVHLLVTSLSIAPKDTIFIGISNSGETAEVISLNRIAQLKQLKTVSITRFGNNRLSREAMYTLQTVKPKESELRSAATSSLMSQFITVDFLFYAYVLKNYQANMERIQKSRKMVDVFKHADSKIKLDKK